MKTGRKINVAMFGHYYPLYRKGVLEKLSSLEDIDFTAYGTENFPVGLKLLKPGEVKFNLQNIRTLLFKIPFTNKRLAIQPTMLLKIVSFSHDVYIIPNVMSYVDVWISLILSRILRRRICLWGHGKGSMTGRFANWCRKFFMGMADSLIFYSESGLEAWRRTGLSKAKMAVAYNALDTDESANIRTGIQERDIKDFLRAQGLEGKKLIIFIGRLNVGKKPSLIIHAMVHIIGHVPEAHAVIIGDGAMKPELQRLLIKHGLEQFVSLKGAIFDEKTIAKYLIAAKVAVMPAQAGLFVQHVFDYGLPIVVGNDLPLHGPEIELVRENETGLFFNDGDSNDLAEKVLNLLLDEKKRLQMSMNAKRLIKEKYNIDTMLEGLVEGIRLACAGKH